MRMTSAKAFSIAFCLTAAVLIPLIFGVYWLSQWQNSTGEQDVAQSQTGVSISLPSDENCMSVLVCITGDEPSFVLVLLDAPNNEITLTAIPSQGVLLNGSDATTVAESYASAGPARVTQLLNATLGLSIGNYLAISQSNFNTLASGYGSVRVGLSGALDTDQLAAVGETEGTVQDWSIEEIQAFLAEISADDAIFTPQSVAAVRGAFWETWLRDKLSLLPSALPDGLRALSSSLLTDISATGLYTLGDTLEFLANGNAGVSYVTLPGSWNATTARYEFSDDTLAVLNASFSAIASGAQSDSSSAP